MKLLLHICCAPCSAACIKVLREEEIDVTGYWYNPNIHPFKEYESRLNALKEYSKMIDLNVVYNDYYGLKEFTKNVVNILDNRCGYCYLTRLENTVKYAKENGYDAFSTTLFISPYQKHDLIKKICENLSEKYNIKFLYKDFRPYYYEGKAMFKETGLYMQKYCGCVFSEWVSNDEYNKVKLKLPENFEFLPASRSIVIRKEKENKEQYMRLLFEADPSEKLIRQYLVDGDLFVLTYKNEVTCVAVVTKVDDDICELKNIVTKEEYRGKGYAKKMLKYLCDNYKQKYNKMLVGIAENNIPFYVKQGFDKYEKTIKNFFIDNYEKEIKNGDLVYTNMIFYSKDLKKEIV
ncbi:MAG: epoxyqueuosine reductase QueH [Bacilli bacterium]